MNGTVRLALTYIVKDNSDYDNLKKSLESFMPFFDGLFVVVNGLSGEHDKIHQLVKKFKGTSISISPETNPEVYRTRANGTKYFARFDRARQISFDLVPDEYDYISWADTDDLLQGGTEIRPLMQKVKEANIDLVFCTYYYQYTEFEKGKLEPRIMHERERFIKNKKFRWFSYLHEVLIPIEGRMEDKLITNYRFGDEKQQLLWLHTKDVSGESLESHRRNIEILEAQASDEEYKDPRTLFYLAKTYFDIGTPESLMKSNEMLDKYIPMSGWDEEIGNAYHYKGLIYQRLGKDREAVQFYKEAIKIYPQNPIDYLRLVDCYFKIGQYEDGFFFLTQAGYLPPVKSRSTIGLPFETKLLFITLKYQEAQIKNNLNDMEYWANERHKFIQDELLESVKSTKELNKVAEGFYNYAIYLLKNSPEKVKPYLETLIPPIIEQPFVMNIACSVPPKVWADNEICYYASFGNKHFESWTANNLEKGIGGSESAVIYLSKEWVKKGYKVVVYCDCGNNAGIIDGVEYRHYNTINWNDKFSTIIFWRSPHLLDIKVLNAKRIFYDAHDIESIANWTPERVKKVDKVFFKSRWHRKNLPNIPDSKAVIISNGIES